MEDNDIHRVIKTVEDTALRWGGKAVISRLTKKDRDPFKVLISCMLSLRTRDEVTHRAANRLFSIAGDVYRMAKLSPERVQEVVYPVGFYRNKAKAIKKISSILIEKYNGQVPSTLKELLFLPGVGRKTANLVLTRAFGKPGICVDTHVHRITNRWGYVHTRTPEKTELALREKLPGEYWIRFNNLLVNFGQRVCTPVSPFCSRCPVEKFCRKVGVGKSR